MGVNNVINNTVIDLAKLNVVTASKISVPGLTENYQLMQLCEGYSQGGYGGGAVGTTKTLSGNTMDVFDMITLAATAKGFGGAVFDGRYIYYVPSNGNASGLVVRYDTTKSFTSSTSYDKFDTTTVNANSKGFAGGVFDGQYIYFVPFSLPAGIHGQVTRYDTTKPFTSASSYAVYDMTGVNVNCKGYTGAVFDGRYVYYIPQAISITTLFIRYDTTQSFAVAGSYQTIDLTTVNANCKGFWGGAFDGRYVYLVPYNNGSAQGQITRYDTTQTFTAVGSYSIYDTTAANANSKGFISASFDGRYMYFSPFNNGVSFGQITRYDTLGSFTSASSYAFFDTTTVNANSKGFAGSVFDGKYLYLIPNNNGANFGQVTRYDTTLPFTLASSYVVFDTTAVNANSKGFLGGVWDGHYLYLSPYRTTLFAGQVTRLEGYSGARIIQQLPDTSWVEITTTSATMAPNLKYVANNAGLVTLTLPLYAPQYATLKIVGKGAGMWSIAQNAGQQITFGVNSTTTGVGGSLAASYKYDSVTLVCMTENTGWRVDTAVGNLVYV